MKSITLIMMLLFSCIFLIHCGEIKEFINCKNVCEKKHDCVDSSYNVDHCRNECNMKADESKDYEQKLNDCNACLETRACVEAVSCLTSCPALP